MKKIILAFLLLSHAYGMRMPEDPIEAADWYRRMEAGVEKWKVYPHKQKAIQELADYVFKFGYRIPNHPDPRWHDVYFRAQSALISIPGHAEYFERRRAGRRQASEDFLQDTEYHRSCETLQETLAHLPSPETVRVLGRLLERTDEVYTHEQDMWMLEQENKGKHMRWFVPAFMGGSTLLKLGLREYPKGSGPEGEFRTNDIERMRAWWAEVKSGQRTFSFIGRKVEYRFKPDGTWETLAMTNPPDDGPKPALETTIDRPIKQSTPAQADSSETSRDPSWWWFGIGGLVLLVAGAWIWRKNQIR